MFIEHALAGLGQLGELDQVTLLAAAKSALADIMRLYGSIPRSADVPAYAEPNRLLGLAREQELKAIAILGSNQWLPPSITGEAHTLINNGWANFSLALKKVQEIKAASDVVSPSRETPIGPGPGPVLPPARPPAPTLMGGIDMKTGLILAAVAYMVLRR